MKYCIASLTLLSGFVAFSMAAEISGIVTDSLNGGVLHGATVTLSKFGSSGRWDWKWDIIGTTTTDASGRYLFSNLDSTGSWESYRVRVEKAGYVSMSTSGTGIMDTETKVIDVKLRPLNSPIRLALKQRNKRKVEIQKQGRVIVCFVETTRPLFLHIVELDGTIVHSASLIRGLNRIPINKVHTKTAVLVIKEEKGGVYSTRHFSLQ